MKRVRWVVAGVAAGIVLLAVSAAVSWLPRDVAAVAMVALGAVGSMSGVAVGLSDTPVPPSPTAPALA